jgi:hypothetical protein
MKCTRGWGKATAAAVEALMRLMLVELCMLLLLPLHLRQLL